MLLVSWKFSYLDPAKATFIHFVTVIMKYVQNPNQLITDAKNLDRDFSILTAYYQWIRYFFLISLEDFIKELQTPQPPKSNLSTLR